MNVNQSQYIKFNDKVLLDALRCESKEEVLRIIREYFDNIKDVFISPVWSIYLAIRINLLYSTFLSEIGEEDQYLTPPQSMIEEIALELDTQEKLQKYMEEICLSALELRNNSKRRNHSELVELAKTYIENNYTDPQISLRNVAAQIYISDCHLSTIFSRETGTTFIQYLTNLRIKKAKELLQTTNMKAGNVGLLVGYKDPHYFSFTFKKNVGCNPSLYKKLNP
jgi:two-component system, response regulator YesN